MKRISIYVASFMLFVAFSALGQKGNSKNQTSTSAVKAESYKGLKWRNIGPFRGGRANTIAGDPLHRKLMEINPANVSKFKDVTQFFADDLKKQEDGNGSAN